MPPTDIPESRRQLVALRAATLQAQAARMGLKGPDEPISAAALNKIETDVAAIPDADLPGQIARWTDLKAKALAALKA